MSRCLREGDREGCRCPGGRRVVSARSVGALRTDGPRFAACGLRFSKPAVERLREERGRARPSVEANLGMLRLRLRDAWCWDVPATQTRGPLRSVADDGLSPAVCPPPLQGEDPLADSVLTFVAQTSALTYAPAARADFAGGRPLRTLHRLQPDELSPKVAGGVDRQRLVAALGAYAARKAAAPARDGDPEPRGLVRVPWRAARVLSAPAAPQRWPSPADPRDAPVTDDGKHPAPFQRLQSFSGTCLGWTFEGLFPFPGLPLREGWGVGKGCRNGGRALCLAPLPGHPQLFPGLVDEDAGGGGGGGREGHRPIGPTWSLQGGL